MDITEEGLDQYDALQAMDDVLKAKRPKLPVAEDTDLATHITPRLESKELAK